MRKWGLFFAPGCPSLSPGFAEAMAQHGFYLSMGIYRTGGDAGFSYRFNQSGGDGTESMDYTVCLFPRQPSFNFCKSFF